MSVNNNNPSKGIGAPSSSFGNAGIPSPSNPGFSQSQAQAQLAAGFQGQFPLSQAHAIAQAQSKAQAQAQAHAQAAAHAQLQAHLQAQGLTLNPNQSGGLGNLGVSPSQLGSTPGNASGKRIPLKPPIRPSGFSPPNNFSPLRPMELTPAARRKKQKLPEKQLQDKVAAILPESALYTQLLEFESRVDAALARKKVDIQEALKNPPCIQKTLRIYVFNTFANQIRTIPKKPNAEPPTWTLKIVGRILEDGVDPDQPGVAQKSSSLYPKFSAFFKRVTIGLDQRLYPDNHIIMWENVRSPAPQEGFEVKRKGDKEFTVNIRLEMNYVPEKFKLSPALTEVLGIEVDTRPRIIAAIWHYVKARKLQNPNDPSFFHCDQPLQKVFGEEKMKFTMVSQKISQHLFPPQPILLEHKIKLSGNSPVGTACYDVTVDVPFPIQRELSVLLANVEKNKEIETLDEAICGIIRKIHEHRRRRAFFLGFSQSPVEFINALIESQSRDLKLVAGESSRSAEKERRSDFFNQPWVEDAVIRYLNRKPAAGSDAPGST
ncbi:SWI/SNF complex component SNF12 homolog [Gastrolobium bilobum]|uniref:SWI/SNF complex component SNF12 homolog n=1 Tax=Gastrolobium bilobum TaxID=150636 RepID=UPI002AB02D4E|nr:SWI/SNF complex component SNF12 homolog [Gastrolobium bilobum]XP_061348865.1 SWI/SNF complex component SNF12 homolog [Gastrolobium bilobum]XP_061348866.1 SWI/SNF complex component SNF12 homolog [Gastrolobium bilobum]